MCIRLMFCLKCKKTFISIKLCEKHFITLISKDFIPSLHEEKHLIRCSAVVEEAVLEKNPFVL